MDLILVVGLMVATVYAEVASMLQVVDFTVSVGLIIIDVVIVAFMYKAIWTIIFKATLWRLLTCLINAM